MALKGLKTEHQGAQYLPNLGSTVVVLSFDLTTLEFAISFSTHSAARYLGTVP